MCCSREFDSPLLSGKAYMPRFVLECQLGLYQTRDGEDFVSFVGGNKLVRTYLENEGSDSDLQG